jgi:prevent-host-death family protein
MVKEMTIVEARSRLTQLPEELGAGHDTSSITITRHGKPVMALMDFDLFETIRETLAIMGDPTLMKSLRASVREVAEGKTIPWDEAKKQLGI